MPPRGKHTRPNTVFKPVELCENRLLVKGGYNRRSEPTLYRSTIVNDTEKLMFLRMESREPWLIAGATGNRQISKGLSVRTNLLQELRKKLTDASSGAVASDIRCSGEASPSSGSNDPMAEVAEDEVINTKTVKNEAARRTRWFRHNCKNKIIEVEMPEKAPETGLDFGTRKVRLYCVDRLTIWICTKDADWALEYLRAQLECKGVRCVDPGDRGPGALRNVPPGLCTGARPASVQVQPAPAGPPVVAGLLAAEDVALASPLRKLGLQECAAARRHECSPASTDCSMSCSPASTASASVPFTP